MNYWNLLSLDNVAHVLSFCQFDDIVSVASVNAELRHIAFAPKCTSIWNSSTFKTCVKSEAACWCGRRRLHGENLLKVLKKFRLWDVEICCTQEYLIQYIRAMGVQKCIKKICFHLDIVCIENFINEMSLLPTLKSENYSSLTSLTVISKENQYFSRNGFTALLNVLGRNLTYLSLWPSSPRGFAGQLHEKCPHLKYLRLDSYARDDSPPIKSHSLEELYLSYPQEKFVYKSGLEIPNLRRLTRMGAIDDVEAVSAAIKVIPPTLTFFELGDSSACASNQVFVSIAARISSLEWLVIKSEDRAHLLLASTMEALGLGCANLHTLDLSTALVLFDEGAIEAFSSYPNLKYLSIPYSNEYKDRIKYVLKKSKSIKNIVLVLGNDDEEDDMNAKLDLEELRHEFKDVTFKLEDS